MDVSPNALRKETLAILNLANGGLESSNLTDEVRATLILAKAQCLQTLTLLNEQGKPTRGGPRR